MLTLLRQAAAADTTGAYHAVQTLANQLLDYLLPIAAVGALAMALIEAAKKLLDGRARFQARRWSRWMRDWEPDTGRRLTAYAQLVQLSTGVTPQAAMAAAERLDADGGRATLIYPLPPSPAHAVFAMEPAAMMQVLVDSVDVALAAPRQYEALYDLMTSGADDDDRTLWKSAAGALGGDPAAARAAAARLARVRQSVKRRLDAFQVLTTERWATANQVWANLVGIAIMAIALSVRTGDGATDHTAWEIAGFSMLGGILAPVAKDLVSAIRSIGK